MEDINIIKERYFKHKATQPIVNIKGGAGTWLTKTETTEAIHKKALLFTDMLSSYEGYKNGEHLIKDIHTLCLSLPDDGQKYTAILKRDAVRLMDIYTNFETNFNNFLQTL